MSDNISLKYLFDQQNLKARQARWLSFLSEYDFEIKQINGKENKVVDALSRNAIPLCSAAFNSYKTNLEYLIKEAAKNDEEYLKIKEQLETNDKGSYSAYSISSEDLLVYKNRLYIPDSEEVKRLILNELHKKPYSGHPGYQKMITKLRKNYYWPNMKNDAANYLVRCIECQQIKTEH